ncbi:MAG: polysaccharide pyruvyl transferase family protein [Clostridia bacterium]|nr:polysaccharide pyruvyl transferase family protein [Clostridia bacterium]
MKVGIVTFHKADNYGAVLQAYALQRTLTNLGVDSDFLDFQESKAEPHNTVARQGAHAFVERLREAGKTRAALFDTFRAKYLRCSLPLPAEQVEDLNNRYDAFVAGSDQVWNLCLPESDERYFLSFASPEKRFSYAASFGMDRIPGELKAWYADRLSQFQAISVREERGREMVRELTGRNCVVCLDPVLLLKGSDWQSLIASGTEERPYLFLYMVVYDADLAVCAKREAEDRGLELRVATAGFVPQFGLESWSNVDVGQWLSLIHGCSGAFTNSFHCTAFAMLFGRPVKTARLRDSLMARNGRLAELLDLAGTETPGEPAALSAEDFALRIREKRQSSIGYLRSSLTLSRNC